MSEYAYEKYRTLHKEKQTVLPRFTIFQWAFQSKLRIFKSTADWCGLRAKFTVFQRQDLQRPLGTKIFPRKTVPKNVGNQ